MKAILQADGGARGNPGPAGAGAVVFGEDGKSLSTVSRFIPHATNNEAEYAALIFGLQEAGSLGVTRLKIQLDSKLIVEQISGRWKIKEPRMKVAAEKVHVLLAKFDFWKIEHIPRARNSIADGLANAAMDSRGHTKSVR